MAKLILNSNYGKFGQEEITNKIEIGNRKKGEEIMTNIIIMKYLI